MSIIFEQNVACSTIAGRGYISIPGHCVSNSKTEHTEKSTGPVGALKVCLV